MRYGSVCSGIEAATVAWKLLGWSPAFFAEIEPFPSAVLAHYYPEVPNHGDFTTIGADDYGAIDLLVGGTPCQSFSVAGRRAGLADPRGNLTLEYCALLERLRPRWMVLENVPGILSDDDGRTFGTVLGALAECGYGFAYRVLDAQYFGIPQRRRRVYIIGYRGDWRPPAAVLFERASLSGGSAPRRKRGADIAASLTRGADSQGKGGYAGRRREDDVNLVAALTANGVGTCGADDNQAQAGHLVFQLQTSASRSMNPLPIAPTMGTTKELAIFSESGPGWWRDGVGTMTSRDGNDGVQTGLCVHAQTIRRLTPRECERLQGFPDDYTRIPWRTKAVEDCPDGPRYRALGNSFAVPVVRWSGGSASAYNRWRRHEAHRHLAPLL